MKAPGFWAVLVVLSLSACARPHPTRTAQPRPARTAHPRSFYVSPLFSPGAQFGTLPPPVQNTVRAEAGTAEIRDVVMDSSTVPVVYKIYFHNHEIFPPLYVASDGSVLNPDLTVAVAAPQTTSRTGLKLADLPPETLKVVHDRAPGAEIASISKESWGDRIVYIIAFKEEPDHPKLYVATDGTIFSESPK